MIRQYYIEENEIFTLGDSSAAINAWQKIIEIDPDNESVRKNIEEADQRLKKLRVIGGQLIEGRPVDR